VDVPYARTTSANVEVGQGGGPNHREEFADSSLEGNGFELPVPREKGSVQKLRRLPPASKVFAFRRSTILRRNRRLESIPLQR
jgi:hypothetical protein